MIWYMTLILSSLPIFFIFHYSIPIFYFFVYGSFFIGKKDVTSLRGFWLIQIGQLIMETGCGSHVHLSFIRYELILNFQYKVIKFSVSEVESWMFHWHFVHLSSLMISIIVFIPQPHLVRSMTLMVTILGIFSQS